MVLQSKRFGKRDVEALKDERQGFLDAKGESVTLVETNALMKETE
jgi:hypothetical protein